MNYIRKIWTIFLDILFPQICLRCKDYLSLEEDKDNLLCSTCFNQIKFYKNAFFLKNGNILIKVFSSGKPSIKALINAYRYKNMDEASLVLLRLIDKFLAENKLIDRHKAIILKENDEIISILTKKLANELGIPIKNRLEKDNKDLFFFIEESYDESTDILKEYKGFTILSLMDSD